MCTTITPSALCNRKFLHLGCFSNTRFCKKPLPRQKKNDHWSAVQEPQDAIRHQVAFIPRREFSKIAVRKMGFDNGSQSKSPNMWVVKQKRRRFHTFSVYLYIWADRDGVIRLSCMLGRAVKSSKATRHLGVFADFSRFEAI